MKKRGNLLNIGIFCLILILVVSCGQLTKDANSYKGKANDVTEAGLYPASTSTIRGSQWGYINSSGKFIIQPKFDNAQDFQKNGLAIVSLRDYQGIINKTGQYIVEPKYGFINQYSEGLAIAGDDIGYKVLNQKGQIVFESSNYIQDFQDGRAVFSKQVNDIKYLYGYIDKTGKIIIEPKYERANSFKEGKALVKLDGGSFALIDLNGKVISQYDYYYVGNLSEGLMAFEEKEGSKTGYIDEKGNVVIPPKFTWGDEFKNGLAVVNLSDNYFDRKSGLINKKGEYILEPKYNDIHILGEDRIAVGMPLDKDNPAKGSKYALANEAGKLLTDFDYYYIYDFEQGLASAYDNTSTFFINLKGKKQNNLPVVKGIGDLFFVDDLIKANIDNRISYYSRKGKLVWKPDNITQLENGITIEEEKYRPNRNILIYYPQLSDMKSKSVQYEVNKKLKDIFIPEEYRKVKSDENLDFNYEAEFSIKFYKKDLLNIEMTGYEYPFGAAHGMPVKEYIHLNTQSGVFYQLKDLFKKDSDYVNEISEIIRKQIEEHGDEMGVWMDDYKGIEPDQPFIILDDSLQIYFSPYEIAPYAAGFPIFTIHYKEIMDIIDTQGSLWKAFH